MNELYLVQAEYMMPDYDYSQVCPIAITPDYEYAKRLCEETVNEDIAEGTIPDGAGHWDSYHDMFKYQDDAGTTIFMSAQ